MKLFRQFHLPLWILAAACEWALLLFAPAPALAQSSGPVVDVCSSGSYSFVDSYIYYGNDNVTIEETACLSGNASGLNASVSADQTGGEPVYAFGETLQMYDNGKLYEETGVPGTPDEYGEVVPNLGDTYYLYGYLNVSEYSGEWNDSVSEVQTWGQVTGTIVQGYVDLRYIVLGVTYAPPGPSTNTFVQYTNSTLSGNTITLSSSFLGTYTESVSFTSGLTIPGVLSGSIESTKSTTTSQTITGSSSATTGFQVQTGMKTYGGGTYMAPVDNDYDTIWVWLNPVDIFSMDGKNITWDGYGYNEADENQPDIVGIPLGYLAGC
jgi:hypothetical protein